MEIQLQELLDKIKKEGVESAELEAAAIREASEKNRTDMLEEARREAAAILAAAKTDVAKLEEASKAALAQASRDCLLSFRDKLQNVLADAVKAETKSVLGPEFIATLIPVAVKALAAGGSEDLTVLLPAADLAKLEAHGSSLLEAELKKGLVLKPSADVDAGFRIMEKDGAAYYDFSADSLAEIFSSRLNGKLGAIVKNAAAGI